jgi:DNA modification methylase
MNNIITLETQSLSIHPLVKMVYRPKGIENIKFTLKKWGQLQNITCVKNENDYYIIDGVSRYYAALECTNAIPTLNCEIVELQEEEILDYRIKINTRTQKSKTEMCLEIEHILGILGKQQGKKREILGVDLENLDADISPKIKKDRMYWACVIVGVGYSPSTIRKLMKVFWDEQNQAEKTGVMDLLDNKKISIEKAYSLLKQKDRKVKELAQVMNRKIGGNLVGKGYKLYNKSSLDLSEIPDGSLRMSIGSPPYADGVREYRFQDELRHGQEESVEEYIDNQIKFCREVRKKLMKNGVMVIIIGESYKNGYQGVGTKLETALVNDGWKIIDVNIWVKENPKYTPHPNRFVNAYERIIVATNSDTKGEVFNDVKVDSSAGKFKVVKGSDRKNGESGYSMSSPLASRHNVFITPVFNPSVLKKIDPDFTHDAPCREGIYSDLIEAYSNPGDFIFDGYVGSCTLSVGLKLGRNIIGYDVDPVSIEFSKKRCEYVLNEMDQTLKIAA